MDDIHRPARSGQQRGSAPPGETGPVPRRRVLNAFLTAALGGLAAAVLYPILRFLTPPEAVESGASQVEAGPVNDPEFVRSAFKIVQFGGEPVIVIRVSEQDFRAFSATCTHLGCIVGYRQNLSLIWCNCHNGRFDLQGRVVGGPPPRPLAKFAVHLVAGVAGGAETVVVSRS